MRRGEEKEGSHRATPSPLVGNKRRPVIQCPPMRRLARRLLAAWLMPGLARHVGDETALYLFDRARTRALLPLERGLCIMLSGPCLGIGLTHPLFPSPPHGAGIRILGVVVGFGVPLMYFVACVMPRVKRSLRRVLAECGHCPGCGYDLRASPDRCPECGAAVEFVPSA